MTRISWVCSRLVLLSSLALFGCGSGELDVENQLEYAVSDVEFLNNDTRIAGKISPGNTSDAVHVYGSYPVRFTIHVGRKVVHLKTSDDIDPDTTLVLSGDLAVEPYNEPHPLSEVRF